MRLHGWPSSSSVCLAALAVSGWAITPATAAAQTIPAGARPQHVKPSDAAATHAYLEAEIGERRILRSEIAQELQSFEPLAAQLRAECPGILAGSPLQGKAGTLQPTSTQAPSPDTVPPANTLPPSPRPAPPPLQQSELEISQELLFGVLGAPEREQHAPIARFSRLVQRLHWSNPKLTKLLHSLAREAVAQSALATPPFCADLTAWAASGYMASSPGTRRFLQRLQAISSITQIEAEPHEQLTLDTTVLVAHRLTRYENAADKALARKLMRREARSTEPALRDYLQAASKVYEALEKPPPAAA